MTHKEAKIIKNAVENALIALVHAQEGDSNSDDYISVAIEWLDAVAHYTDIAEGNSATRWVPMLIEDEDS